MSGYTLAPFDQYTADDEALRPLWAFEQALHGEQDPDDPPLPFEDFLTMVRARNSTRERRLILAHDAGGALVGRGTLYLKHNDGAPTMARAQVEVLPAHRLRGVGRRLLEAIIAQARAAGRATLNLNTNRNVPSGEAFLQRVGARKGMVVRVSQLRTAEVDRGLLRAWQERASERAASFELLFWDTEVPEEHIEAYARLVEVMDTAPHDELEVEPDLWTAERLREEMRAVRAAGITLWTLVAREVATGALAGYTEIYFHKGVPAHADQGDTGVEPRYRNRGLGRWLKAAMLERVLRDLPTVRSIRTGNAESNGPMLAINEALGFKPYRESAYWQLQIAD
jgi:mycothiol synthase